MNRPNPSAALPSPRELHLLVRDALADANDALAAADVAIADELARDILAAVPDHPGALTVLGRLAFQAKEYDDAEALLRRALLFDPTMAAAHFALADVLSATLRLGDAFVSLQNGVKRSPDEAQRWRALGGLGLRLGFRDQALTAFQRAVALHPADVDLRCDLATAAGVSGKHNEAERLFRALVDEAPDHPRAHANLGSALAAVGRHHEAALSFDRAVALAPGFVDAWANLARCLGVLGRGDEALSMFAEARRLAPDDLQVPFDEGRLLLDLRRAPDALALADDLLSRRPAHAGMLALRLLSLRALGRHADADELAAIDRFVRALPLPLPPGYATPADFACAMASHVKTHPSLAWAPSDHATINGHHSGSLQVPPLGPVAAFEGALMQALASYVKTLPADDDHPFIKHRPQEIYLDIWGVVMGDMGHQTAHIHPAGWCSGVYYAALPTLGPAQDPRGWLQMGNPDRALPGDVTFPVKSIEPQAGWLVLFPSYLYHHTIPVGPATADRISVAFDVLALS